MGNPSLTGVEGDPGGPDRRFDGDYQDQCEVTGCIGSFRCTQSGRLRAGGLIRWRILDEKLQPVDRFYVVPENWESSPLTTGKRMIPGRNGLTHWVQVNLPRGKAIRRYRFSIRVGDPKAKDITSEDAYFTVVAG